MNKMIFHGVNFAYKFNAKTGDIDWCDMRVDKEFYSVIHMNGISKAVNNTSFKGA